MSLKVFSPFDSYAVAIANRFANRVTDMFNGVHRDERLKGVDSITANALAELGELITSLGSGPNFNEYFPTQAASIIQLNADVQRIRDRIRTGISNMVRMEERQLQDFNITDQRVSFLKGRLADLERDITTIESDQQAGVDVVVFSESFGDLAFIDTDQTPQDKIPTLSDGFITLPEETVEERPSLSGAKISIDRVNHSGLTYPSKLERPTNVVHEGRYYGFPGEARPEGARWNIRLNRVAPTTSESDLFGLANDPTTYLFENSLDLEELVPDIGDEPSNYVATNLGWPESVVGAGRSMLLDGNPETFWEMEYIRPLEISENLDSSEIVALTASVADLNKGSLEVSLLIDLGRNVRTNGINITPYISSQQSKLETKLEISGTDPGAFIEIPGISLLNWSFPSQNIRFIRLTLTETSVQLTPYPVMVVILKRGLTHISQTEVVPD